MRHPGAHPRSLTWIVALSLLRPGLAVAAPTTGSPELSAFEGGFTDGQAQYDRGELLPAARTWVRAAENLRETTTHRDNRTAVYEYVADAYVRGLVGSQDLAALREAVAALTAYCDGFTRAYGTETPISPRITGPRDALQRQLAEAEAAAVPAPPPGPSEPSEPSEPSPPPAPAKPWKPLVIGGGVMLGLGVGAAVLAIAGAARGRSFEQQFDDPAAMCSLDAPSPPCAALYDKGKSSNTMAIAGVVAAPLLLGAGVALLVLGLKRKATGRDTARLVPTLAPGFAGFTLTGRF